MSEKFRIGIIGATGYVGMELVKILQAHPGFRLSYLSSQSFVGQKFSDIYPAFRGLCDMPLKEIRIDEIASACDLVITALPHGVAAQTVPALLERGLKVLDHSGDFRFKDVKVYEETYRLDHPAPALLEQAVYGLPELYREKLRNCTLISNPGCYPTCSILCLAPLLAKGLVETDNLIVDAVSGVSGAGRQSSSEYSFCETEDNFRPYGVVDHRHQPEIVQELSLLAGKAVSLSFTPHLAPFARGMMVTAYARPVKRTAAETAMEENWASSKLVEVYEAYFKYDVFVRILPPGKLPQVAAVKGSNYIDISPIYDEKNHLIKIFAAIDNLGKGAASQAVQSINILAGFPETEGLARNIHLL